MKLIEFYDEKTKTAQVIAAHTIVSAFIDKKDLKSLTIWLDGGRVVNNHYLSEEECRRQFDTFVGLLREA